MRQRAEELNQRLGELSSPNEQAAAAMQGAQEATEAAEEAMQNNRSSAAAREGASAAAQMRAAAQALGGDGEGGEENEDNAQANQEEQDERPDVIALLRDLVVEQSAVVTQATILHKSEQTQFAQDNPDQGSYDALSWPGERELGAIASKQDGIALRLVEEGLEELSQQPIAARALERVLKAVNAAHEHFIEPALGARGIRLPKIALFEMQRLLAIAEDMPPPPEEEGEGDSQNGEGGGEQETPPFPPAAELAFVRAEQERIAWQTRTRQPGDLAAEQGAVGELLGYLLQTVRPGSRGQVLLERSQRAMLSAQQRLADSNDRGSLTQTEQDVALASLTQLLRESQEAARLALRLPSSLLPRPVLGNRLGHHRLMAMVKEAAAAPLRHRPKEQRKARVPMGWLPPRLCSQKTANSCAMLQVFARALLRR